METFIPLYLFLSYLIEQRVYHNNLVISNKENLMGFEPNNSDFSFFIIIISHSSSCGSKIRKTFNSLAIEKYHHIHVKY